MLKVFVFVIGCLAVSAANVVRVNVKDKVVFKDCGSKGATINSVDVTPCPVEPCKFQHNKNVSVQIGFTAKEDIKAATTKVYGLLAGIPVPFPLNDANACHDMKCPVAKGSSIVYKNLIFVKPSYPKVRVVVKWEVVDSDDNMVLCFEVPVEITD